MLEKALEQALEQAWGSVVLGVVPEQVEVLVSEWAPEVLGSEQVREFEVLGEERALERESESESEV